MVIGFSVGLNSLITYKDDLIESFETMEAIHELTSPIYESMPRFVPDFKNHPVQFDSARNRFSHHGVIIDHIPVLSVKSILLPFMCPGFPLRPIHGGQIPTLAGGETNRVPPVLLTDAGILR